MMLSEKEIALMKQYEEIVNNEEYNKLKNISRHANTNTFEHSIRVAYWAGYLTNRTGADASSAIRVGLLHDFCLVDYHMDHSYPGPYIFYHPKEAVINSDKFNLTEAEKEAILSHMFPAAPLPKSRIAWIITVVDKIVAVYEGCCFWKKKESVTCIFCKEFLIIIFFCHTK